MFDVSRPDENQWLFRLANKLHINTRPQILRRDILFQPGDAWDPLLSEESERILRGNPYLKNASITPVPAGPGKVDLRVRTQDTWTLALYTGFETRGGESRISYGVEEKNLLGLGKTLSLYKTTEAGQAIGEVRYLDPRLLGSWVRLTALEAERDNGSESQFLIERPYYSLRTPAAFDLGQAKLDRDANLYDASRIFSTFRQGHEFFRAGVGCRVSEDPVFPRRIDLRYLYQNDAFHAEDATSPQTLPEGRTLSGFMLGYSWVESDYIQGSFINRAERVEDFNLGNQARLAAGPFPKSLGSDRDRWLFEATEQQGVSLGRERFLQLEAGASGRSPSGGRLENGLLYGDANLYWKAGAAFPLTWVGHSELAWGRNLDRENQFVLGGQNGMRGYRLWAFTGGEAGMANLEARAYYPREILSLAYLGGAAFFDVGAVEPEGEPFAARDVYSDVGLGLRVGPTRSSQGIIARVDLAYALRPGPGGGSRWVLSIATGHAFAPFNNASHGVQVGPATELNSELRATRLEQ